MCSRRHTMVFSRTQNNEKSFMGTFRTLKNIQHMPSISNGSPCLPRVTCWELFFYMTVYSSSRLPGFSVHECAKRTRFRIAPQSVRAVLSSLAVRCVLTTSFQRFTHFFRGAALQLSRKSRSKNYVSPGLLYSVAHGFYWPFGWPVAWHRRSRQLACSDLSLYSNTVGLSL